MEEGDEEEVEEARIDGGDVVRLRFCTGRDDFEILADKTLHEATLLVIIVDNDDAMELGKKTRSERVARRGLLGDSIKAANPTPFELFVLSIRRRRCRARRFN
jgi:hypothetical protein